MNVIVLECQFLFVGENVFTLLLARTRTYIRTLAETYRYTHRMFKRKGKINVKLH